MPGDSRLHPGRVLCDGKWRIEAPLGEGGMATVWSACHRNGLRAAIKALRPELSADDEVRDRFLREGYLANKIDHKGVLQVLDDAVSEDGVVFLVMELLDGMSLKELWLSRDRQLLPSEVIRIATAVLEVLEASHACGIIHRDIKPDNVFMLADGGIKVLDFGIARLREIDAVDQRTRTGAMLGTPAFMPPEQALGRWDQVDARSDLFAVAASMWTLLTGGLVHVAATVQELLVAAATARARPIRDVLPDLNPRLAAVIDRALSFERHARFPDAAAMRRALEPLTSDGSTDVMELRPAPPSQQIGAHGSWRTFLDTLPTPPHAAAVGGPPLHETRVLEAPPAVSDFGTGTPTTRAVSIQGGRRRGWWAGLVALLLTGAVIGALAFANTGAVDDAETDDAEMERPSATEGPNDSEEPQRERDPAPLNDEPTPLPDDAQPEGPTSANASAAPRAPPPTLRPPPVKPPPPKPTGKPALDCAGADFADPACAR